MLHGAWNHSGFPWLDWSISVPARHWGEGRVPRGLVSAVGEDGQAPAEGSPRPTAGVLEARPSGSNWFQVTVSQVTAQESASEYKNI